MLLVYGLFKETVTAIMMLNKNTKPMLRSPDGDADVFDIVAGVLQKDIFAPYEGTGGLVDIVVRNRLGDQVSNPGRDCLHFTMRPWEKCASNYSPSNYWWIVEQTGFLNHGMATSLGEGNLNSNLLNSAFKIKLVLCGRVVKFTMSCPASG